MQHGAVHGVQFDPSTVALPANMDDVDLTARNAYQSKGYEVHTVSCIGSVFPAFPIVNEPLNPLGNFFRHCSVPLERTDVSSHPKYPGRQDRAEPRGRIQVCDSLESYSHLHRRD
jgi:hypothetical protein